MDPISLLDQFFPASHTSRVDDWLVTGEASLDGEKVAIIGTAGDAFVGGAEALVLAEKILDVVESAPGRTILMLVDNSGQRMALGEELLALPEYVAHALRAQQLARETGSKLIAILYGKAVAGGFIAFGMLADRIIAVPGADPSVMKLEAISRVTKMPLEKLEALAQKVSVFAPGCDSFFKMGGVHEVWNDDFSNRLRTLLQADVSTDNRAALGLTRGGRQCAQGVIDDVLRA